MDEDAEGVEDVAVEEDAADAVEEGAGEASQVEGEDFKEAGAEVRM